VSCFSFVGVGFVMDLTLCWGGMGFWCVCHGVLDYGSLAFVADVYVVVVPASVSSDYSDVDLEDAVSGVSVWGFLYFAA